MFDLPRISSYLSLSALAGLAFIAASSTITRVIDGDSVVLGTGEHARVIGLDTPELRGGPACSLELARTAKARLVEAFRNGEVSLRRVAGREAYNRVLIDVAIRGEPMLTVGLREGWARAADGRRLPAWCES